MERLSARSFGDLVAHIYAAALDPSRWAGCVEALATTSGGVRTQIMGLDARTGLPFNVVCKGYADEAIASWLAYYAAINPWLPVLMQAPTGSLMRSDQMVDEDALMRSEFYHDWVRPQGDVRGGSGLILAREHDRHVLFGGNIRRRDRERLEDAWFDLPGLIAPHLRAALDIGRAFEGRALQAVAATQGGGRTSSAILTLDPRGRILYADRAAERLIETQGVIDCSVQGRLMMAGTGSGALRAALARLVVGSVAAASSFDHVVPGGEIWQVRTVAFDSRSLAFSPFGLLCGFDDRCLVVILSKAPATDALSRRLMQSFGLTGAEVAVAVALAEGRTPAEIADSRRVSIHTVRTQVKAVLGKTGSRRQIDLARTVEAMRRG